jgi:hypothetical protein
MGNATKKPIATRATHPSTVVVTGAPFMGTVVRRKAGTTKACRLLENRRERSVKNIAQRQSAADRQSEPLPFFAKVKVERYKGVPAKAAGKNGLVLGRAQLKTGRWQYSVFLGGLNESYSLPHAALKPTGEVMKRCDIYGNDKVRVVVDERGAGALIDT